MRTVVRLSVMADDELSPECKQRLRDLDHELEAASWAVTGANSERLALTVQIAQKFYAIEAVDDACRQVLRSIDQSAGASLVARLQASSFGDFDALGILEHIARVREAIDFALRQSGE